MSCENCKGHELNRSCPTCTPDLDVYAEIDELVDDMVDNVLIQIMDSMIVDESELKEFLDYQCAQTADELNIYKDDLREIVTQCIYEKLKVRGLNLTSLMRQAEKRLKNGR